MTQEETNSLEGIREHTLTDVREYTGGDPGKARRNLKTGRLMITASNEGAITSPKLIYWTYSIGCGMALRIGAPSWDL